MHVGPWKFLVFTNLLIAFAATAQTLLSYKIFDLPYNYSIVLLEFASTLLLYNLSIWISKPKDYSKSPYERTRWIFSHQSLFYLFNVLAFVLLGYALLQVHLYTFIYLGFIGLLSLGYAIPIYRIQGKWQSLRHIPYMKVFYIALIWSLSTVGLVYIESLSGLQDVGWDRVLYLLMSKFLFIVLVTLPFDIRDMKQDSFYHLKTVPLRLGRHRTERLCYSLIVAHLLLVLFMPTTLPVQMGLLACDMVVWILFKTIILQKQDSFMQVYLLDLVLILQYIFCLLAVQIANYFIR